MILCIYTRVEVRRARVLVNFGSLYWVAEKMISTRVLLTNINFSRFCITLFVALLSSSKLPS